MSFGSSTPNSNTELLSVSNNISDLETKNQEQNQDFQQPVSLTGMLHNKELLTCYKCKEVFDPDQQENEHTLDSNNILMGIILNKRTPSSICLKCLSLKMMELITEQFTKNSKDYTGLFFNYAKNFKS
jgi:hypothetical protein